MEYWTFVRHKSFSDVLVSRYSLQYIWHLMIEQKYIYMQIKGTKLTGNIFWALNFKTRFVNNGKSGKWRTNEGNDWASLSRYKVGRKSGFKPMEQPNYCTKTDHHHHHHHFRQASLSFNESLRLVSCQRRADPDETTLLAVFEWDPVLIIVLMIIVITIIALLLIIIILSTAGLLTQRTRAAYQRSNFARSWAVRWVPFKSSPASWIP